MAKATTRARSTTAKKAPSRTSTRKATTSKINKTTAEKTETAPAKSTLPKTAPVVVREAQAVVAGPEMKKVELIDEVVSRSGVKKRDAKPAIEAALAVLGEALAEGRELNLKPLGKVKVQKIKEISGGQVLITRVRQQNNKPSVTTEDEVAEASKAS